GEVSHYQLRRRSVTDPEWRPSTGYIVRRTNAPVIPAFVCGRNSLFFQLMGCVHPRLRTILLVREFLNKEGRTIRIRLGPPVSPSRAKNFTSSLQLARFLRLRTYSLSDLDAEKRGTPSLRLAAAGGQATPAPVIDPVDPELLEGEFRSLPEEQRLARNASLHA
ncbi:MAG: glycerol acyltransferase, partial [Gammaproteobacteria bacterium]|nr:glycerol acyltransferase [Gammaproteobacteria bacterium]NIV52937.1 glycerol acyltransferase [Gammaproteobacteria bacterium]NIX87090.1 glycerol acyltransferase [Gammaproteobacteria bacterium]